jgi:hypothetical protein
MSTGRFLSLCSHVLLGALAVPLLALAVRAQTTPAMPQYMFRVPVLPHTELFKSIPPLAELNTPVATIVEVFRTTDGRPLNTESVISFYRTALGTKGWKQGISNRQQDEPYLSMRTDLVETLPDRTQIQLAGDFYLWIAPRDGMFTVYMKQWRISSIDQATHDSLQTVIGNLMNAAPRAGYRPMKVASDTDWPTDYENEYLVDRVLYALVPPGAGNPLDGPPGTLIVSLMTYRDVEIAKAEEARRQQEFKSRATPHYAAIAAAKGKTLVTIVGDAAEDKLGMLMKTLLPPQPVDHIERSNWR